MFDTEQNDPLALASFVRGQSRSGFLAEVVQGYSKCPLGALLQRLDFLRDWRWEEIFKQGRN